MPDESSQTVIVLACRDLSNDGESDGGRSSSFELAYLVYDRNHNKIVTSLEKIIQLLIPEKKEALQPYSSNKTGLSERQGLREILQELEPFLEKQPVFLVTFGPLTLRHFIHFHSNREKIKLHEGLYSYYDIGIEFLRNYPEHVDDPVDIQQIASYFNIELPSTEPHGLQLCRLILDVMQRWSFDGSRQIIQSQYSHIPSSASLVEDTVVRARGFNPNTTEVKLAKLFAGLNIESGGIVLCMSPHGRPNSEALIRFTDKEQRDLALKRSGSKFGARNIEICPASVQEFSRMINQADHAYGMPNALTNFLLLATPAAVIIRMRGLPYNTKASEIVKFFGDESPVYRGQNGVFFVHHPDRRPTGDAFVLFETTEHGKQALTKDRQTIGKRYVELFQTTKNEVVQVFSRYTFPSCGLHFPAIRAMRPPDHVNAMQMKNYSSTNKDIIRLRGLPYAASIQDILDFLGEYSKYIVPAGVHMVYNSQARPSGDAFIEMRSAEYAQKASETLHKKHIGERYIEVFQCSSSDMAFMLTHGIPNYRNQQHSSWVNGPYSPRTPPHVPTAFTYPPVSSSTLTYPPVSSPPTVPHTSNSPHGSMMSVPSSPTLSPNARVFVTSPSHGYVTYSTPPYNVFNFSYPTSNIPIDGNMAPTPTVISPTPYESTVFFPGYQAANNEYTMGQMDHVYVPVNPYLPPTNGYYPSPEISTDPGHMPAYVETYSG